METNARKTFMVLSHWEERSQKLSVAIPEQIDAVRVMTRHNLRVRVSGSAVPFAANWDSTTERDAKSWVEVDDELNGLPTALIPLNKKLCSAQ